MTHGKIILFTNIPTPYRTFLFNLLWGRLGGAGIAFKVFFMRKTEKGRSWTLRDQDFKFPYSIGCGLYAKVKNKNFHFNPILVLKILLELEESDILILGAGWANPNTIILSILKRLRVIRFKIVFWTEANYLTLGARNSGLLKKNLRRLILETADDYIVPGRMASIALDKWKVRTKRKNQILMPNLINEAVFEKEMIVEKMKHGEHRISNDRLTFLVVARLLESEKGLENFFKKIGPERLKLVNFLVVGEGPDLDRYKAFVYKNKLDENISFLGALPEATVFKLYIEADVFVLPSFSDPSPLSVVEACKCGMPLLISNRCGNHYEALKNGENGFLFDPCDEKSLVGAFDGLLKSDLRILSNNSFRIAEKNFSTEAVIGPLLAYLVSK